MSGREGLATSPLRQDLGFNWVFLVELIVCGILTLFFLFYFNRIFATLVSYALRAWTWHRYRVFLDIQALQISLLGGRVFFKGFKYHGNNETILIQSGFVTWCYWLRNVRQLDISQDQNINQGGTSTDSEKGKSKAYKNFAKNIAKESGSKQLPCRLQVSLKGVEWFVYNRSAAYDAVAARFTSEINENIETCVHREDSNDIEDHLRRRGKPKKTNENSPLSTVSHSEFQTESTIGKFDHSFKAAEEQTTHGSSSDIHTESEQGGKHLRNGPEDAFILRFLPVYIECEKAAVVLGNQNTRTVLITKADRFSGEINATNSTSLDQYKQLINIQFERPVVQMKPNDDFKEDQDSAASRIKDIDCGLRNSNVGHLHSHSFIHRQRRKAWHQLQNIIPAFRSSVESLSSSLNGFTNAQAQAQAQPSSWQGLSRYLYESEQDEKARWSSIEYATVSTILDSSEASMSFYWDVAGIVQEQPHRRLQQDERLSNINGDDPPGWGINLLLKGSTINYGPWADRQRAEIQRVFFPSLCKDATPSQQLLPGQFRVATEFKLNIEFDEETTLRIPIREESKNWKWTKQADAVGARPPDQKRPGKSYRKRKADRANLGPEVRPFGWLDIKVGANAAIGYTMDMVASQFGYSNKLELDLPRTEITTSVNHGLLWRSVHNHISCDLSNPLQWNGQRTWKFTIGSERLELFILREHIFLLIDLVDDWASGPPPEYLTFSPFRYLVNLQLKDFRLYLNVNDSNIINNPSDFDDNTFIIFFGSSLAADIYIPLEKYRPHQNEISFNIDTKHAGLNLHVPPWNTQATFLSSTELATLAELAVAGRYQYCSTTSTSNTDTLLVDVNGQSLSVIFYGFVVRYLLKIKDNYFGDDIRFKTLEEYQEILRSGKEGTNVITNSQPPHKKSNDLDVILTVSANESSVILPSNLYSAKNHISIEVAHISSDLRFTNYYMDLDVVLSPLTFSQVNGAEGSITPADTTSGTQLFVDGVSVSGNRLFGLPPTEPTYVCNWDFAIGDVTGECSTDFLGRLINGGRAFTFSFDDDENALPAVSPEILHDVTFLRASVESIRLWLHVEGSAILVASANMSMIFNDWAQTHFSKKLKVFIPGLQFSCVDEESTSRYRARNQHPVNTQAFFQTTLSLSLIERKLGFAEDRQLQQEHIKRHDQRTHRGDFLIIHNGPPDNSMLVPVNPPAMFPPPLPPPVFLHDNIWDEHSIDSNPRQNKTGLKNSFISTNSQSHKRDFGTNYSSSSLQYASLGSKGLRFPDTHKGAVLNHRTLPRDLSAPTERQSSFYSTVSEHRTIPPKNVTFSSSYIKPHFPLEGVEPDSTNLPEVIFNLNDSSEWMETDFELEKLPSNAATGNSSQLSLIIDFPAGIRGVFNPEAAHAVANVLAVIQAVDPVDILDQLQIDSISEIFKLNKHKTSEPTTLDFGIRAPFVNVRLSNPSGVINPGASFQQTHDQYDISLSTLTGTYRSKTAAPKINIPESVDTDFTIHISLASAGIIAAEKSSNINDPEAAISCVFDDIVFWASSKENIVANISFQDFHLSVAGDKIEYLTSLLHRTQTITENFKEKISIQQSQKRHRVQLFTYLVATAGQKATDPLFLTRPSYVLRSATDHLRTSDSWKIVTRLHHMFSSLDLTTQQDIAARCLSNTQDLPENSQKLVVAGFDQWRSWDLDSIHSCLVMARIYGPQSELGAQPLGERSLKLSIHAEDIHLVIDPGPKQNEMTFFDITITVDNKIASSVEDIGPQTEAQLIQTTLIQLFLANFSLHLNWELCELAESIMRLYREGPSKEEVRVNEDHARPLRETQSKMGHDLQVIITTEKASITLDTINIGITSIHNGFKASFALTDQGCSDTDNITTLVLAADAITTKMKSHTQDLSNFQLQLPSIFISSQKSNQHDQSTVVQLAGNCQRLSLDIKQDILAFLEIIDLLIGDELASFYRLKHTSADRTPIASRSASSQVLAPIAKFNISLFLDLYEISIPLMQSLKYKVSGVVARASVAAQINKEITFDFDIKENSHDVQTISHRKTTSVAFLQIPPTNGRVTCHMSEKEIMLSVFASLEPVKFDAAAVHSLLTTINRPEVLNIVTEVQEDANLIQTHLEELFGPRKQESQILATKRKPLVYDAHFTFAGFDLFANAQGPQRDHNTTRLNFNLGCIQLVATNRLQQDSSVLENPEIRVSMRRIMFELSRWNNDMLEPCGNLAFMAHLVATSKLDESGNEIRLYHIKSESLTINLFADTASSIMDVLGHLQSKIKDLDLSREKNYLRKFRKVKPRIEVNDDRGSQASISSSTRMVESMYSLELLNIQTSWLLGTYEAEVSTSTALNENLVLSMKRIDLSTRRQNSARLTIEDLQVQMENALSNKPQRSLNSALLPEVIFNVAYISTTDTRRLAFQAAGKSLDLRLTSQFMIPASRLQKSISSAAERVRIASASWTALRNGPTTENRQQQPFFGKKRMESLLIDADFAGAVVYLSGNKFSETFIPGVRGSKAPQPGKYGQFTQTDTSNNTVLRAPGLAWKVEYNDNATDDPSLNAEVKVHASSNILYPSVVPLIMEISSTVKDIVSDDSEENKQKAQPPPQKSKNLDENNILTTDPSAVLGRTRLNLGLRICKQEFSLSCQPIARVAATARFDNIYLTVNTVQSAEHGHFFAASAAITLLQASVQHVYSRESTGNFDVDSVFLSLMNSKHVSGTSGLSAILKISPMKVLVNAKQLQDFLLFREIWVPPEIRQTSPPPVSPDYNLQSQTYLVQRYQQVAATGAFPWNATVSIAKLDVQLDLGQAIGKSAFIITNFWISSRKDSDWEQNLCLGFDRVGVDSIGRMSGFVTLQDFKIRTSIQWPAREMALNQTPLVQGSLGFSQLRAKAAFDYQAFLVADITSFEFLMYNIRSDSSLKSDRLVAILDGQAVQVFCTTITASQSLAVYQAFQRLVQEKRTNYEASLAEIEKFMKRKSGLHINSPPLKQSLGILQNDKAPGSPISLHTDVIVTLKAVNVGAFPNTFSDHQIFKLEALNAQARFAVTMSGNKIHSILGLTLGQLRIGLAGVKQADTPKSVVDLSVEDIVTNATGSRGGTILKVPKVEATMQTWQVPSSTHIDYIFKSSFEGKVEVGWNYSRISYIRNMWATHSRALAQRLGKPLPPSAVRITGVPDGNESERRDGEQQKITAEVNVPQSKYDYTALETPVIETPQLRDMGEATPPLEWIGLHRERLPNLTHQIVIVTLLELASEVEDAYKRILGT